MEGGKEGRGGGGCTHFMHNRSFKTIDPRIPYNVGTRHVGFSPARQTSRAPSEKRREVFGESHKRVRCILLRTACEADFRTLCVLSCISDNNFELTYLRSGMASFGDSDREKGIQCNCLVGAFSYAHRVISSP